MKDEIYDPHWMDCIPTHAIHLANDLDEAMKRAGHEKWALGPVASREAYEALREELLTIRREARRALIINRTIGDDIDEKHPPGWMPPKKRQDIIAILQAILAEAGGSE